MYLGDVFPETISRLTNELYGNDIRGRMEDWENFSDSTRKKIITMESDAVFHLLSQFGELSCHDSHRSLSYGQYRS